MSLHLIHIVRNWIVSGSRLDWANPRMVGRLNLDRNLITTRKEVFTWQAHSLIEARVCRKCRVVVGVYKKRMHCCMCGEQTVSKASWMGYPETRLCIGIGELCSIIVLLCYASNAAKTLLLCSQLCLTMWHEHMCSELWPYGD